MEKTNILPFLSLKTLLPLNPFMGNLFKFCFGLLLVSFLPKIGSAQKGMDAVYSNLPGMAGEIYTFHKNFTYHYYAGSCLTRWMDSGYYSIQNDTIRFISIVKEIPAHERQMQLSIFADGPKAKDTIWIEIENTTRLKSSLYYQLYYNDSILIKADSILPQKDVKFCFPKQSILNLQKLKLQVNNAVVEHEPTQINVYTLLLTEWVTYKPMDHFLILGRNKVYPIYPNMDRNSRKYFIPKKRKLNVGIKNKW